MSDSQRKPDSVQPSLALPQTRPVEPPVGSQARLELYVERYGQEDGSKRWGEEAADEWLRMVHMDGVED